MNKLITVIVPVYNAGKTIVKCVDSIVNQTYKNLEIILINDGSKDESLTMCNLFARKDNRIIVVDKPNGGVSSARNTGLDIASGDYVGFVDSDDYIQLDMFDKMLAAIEIDSAQVCACKFNNIHGNVAEVFDEPMMQKAFNGELTNFISNKSVHGSACRILTDRTLIADLRFNTDIKIKEDLLFTVTLMTKALKACVVDEGLYNYVLTANDSDYKKYFKGRYIKDYYFFARDMAELFKNRGCENEVNAMKFRQYMQICKCKIYDKNVKSVKNYFASDELKFVNSKKNYRAFNSEDATLKSKLFAMLAHWKMFGLLKILQKIIDFKK